MGEGAQAALREVGGGEQGVGDLCGGECVVIVEPAEDLVVPFSRVVAQPDKRVERGGLPAAEVADAVAVLRVLGLSIYSPSGETPK